MIVTSYRVRVDARVRKKLGDGLNRGAALLAQAIRAAIAIQGPPRSTPGNPPHVDTGVLLPSYTHQVDRASLTAAVGSDVPYSADLELGTPTMAPRPHVIPTLIRHADDIAREIAKP